MSGGSCSDHVPPNQDADRSAGIPLHIVTEYVPAGQKQRVAIAGVLAMKPELIIYDEATSMLDPVGKKDILDITFGLREENPDLSVISITHDIEEVMQSVSVHV